MKGTIYKRGNTWTYSVDIAPKGYKRKQKTKGGFRTKKECEQALNEIIYLVTNDLYEYETNELISLNTNSQRDCNIIYANNQERAYKTEAVIKTFEEVKLEFLEHHKKKVKYTTYMNYKNRLNTINQIHLNIKDVAKQHIIDNLESKSKAEETQKYFLGIYKLIFEYAVKMKYIKESPIEDFQIIPEKDNIKVFEESFSQKRILEESEIIQLIDYLNVVEHISVEQLQLSIIIKILLQTGLRIGEVLALEWKDIDLDTGKINIYKTINHVRVKKPSYNLSTPKTKASVRTVYINNILLNLLIQYYDQIENIKKLFNDKYWSKEDFVFINLNREYIGLPNSHDFVYKNFKRILSYAHIPEITLHDLRHTYTSFMCKEKIPVEIVSKQLGHASIQMTNAVYIHVTEETKQEMVSCFDKLMLAKC